MGMAATWAKKNPYQTSQAKNFNKNSHSGLA
jgi:hypothetical protein